MRISDLWFNYENKPIFEGLNLEIGDGISCLMGESGIGKTTLLKLIAGLLEPQKGTIENEHKLISFMFQEDRLLPWLNVRDNILLVTDKERETDELLRELEIEGNLKISELSGGMARRVALIRCLLFDSEMLIMDEPFKGMDSKLIEKAAQIIRRQNKPAIISTHSLDEVKALSAEVITL
ncbi:MAG: ATP-binding cassette domain-containing protein [Erysipelotrichaceae bacterium]|nr:ATP-binding cassette domain-containing protein [Erysipelotrichaceae bacterium]MBO4537408.1 ATP-binding cassette domain-containing protein [Erysipelotrichaceae bacterium]